MKPSNVGGGKGPLFKDNARSSKSQEIGDEPTTSRNGSEVTGSVAHQSEGSAELSVLCPIRQGVSPGCSDSWQFGYAKLFQAAIVNYADDFVTRRSSTGLSVEEKVGELNDTIRGWTNYFRLGSVSAAYQAVMLHACRRLRQWLGRKNGTRVGLSRCSDKYLHATLGLIDPAKARKAYRLSCANV